MLAKKILLVCMLAVVVAGFGCAPKFVGSEGGVYQGCTMYAVSAKDMDAVYQATLQTMEKLQLQVTTKAKDVFGAKVVAKSADGKIITVEIKPTEDKKTQFSIKIGAFGNEERSRTIFADIDAALKGK